MEPKPRWVWDPKLHILAIEIARRIGYGRDLRTLLNQLQRAGYPIDQVAPNHPWVVEKETWETRNGPWDQWS